ncbi:MAG: hypothetical protein ACI32E_01065 [Bacilli bacterium]
MAKKEQKNTKQKGIKINERADGMKEVVITKAPSKTLFGKIVIAILAFSMIAAVVASLIIVIVEAI